MNLGPETLINIINIQTEVVKLGLDLAGVMDLVVKRAQQLTHADGAVIELAEDDYMVYRAASETAEKQLGLRLHKETSLSGLCVKVGHALQCSDSEEDPRVDKEACRKVGLRSMVVSPLKYGDILVGAIKVLSSKPNFLDDAVIHVLDLMSELIAASMYNAEKYSSNELVYRATHDQLTGVANRALFYDRLRQRLIQAQRLKEKFSIIILDMDGLKQINDNWGHRAGDAAIQEFTFCIKKATRQTDTVARVGGDEFGIIVNTIKNDDDITIVTQRIENALTQTFKFEGKEIPLHASMGWALFPNDGEELEVLIDKADQRMYTMKRIHKNNRKS